ncbi:MAG: 4Fe-4S dicluster domain-containing protein [Promethearchaeota archaeon]
MLPYGAKEKLIKNNESVDVPKLQILPYELVEILINKHDIFAIQTCECRLIGELSGDPCKVASREIGCLNGGAAAQRLINSGIGRQITKEEAIEYVKKVEKMGLVHATVADNSLASSMFICNCCSCHCVFLKPTKKYRIKTITPSNFIPKRDRERCIKCETCIKKCQMGAIFHQLPNESDLTDDYIFTKEEYCIGCGVCASNCPENAIKMVKIRDDDFSKKVQFEGKFLAELFL